MSTMFVQKIGLMILLWFLSLPTHAMEAISDLEMSEVTGQAFISVSTSTYDQGGTQYEFTKINLGLIIETLLNTDLLKIGEFDRNPDDGRNGDGTVRITDANGNETTGSQLSDGNGGNYGRHDTNNDGVWDADVIIENFAVGHVEHDGFSYEDALQQAKDAANNGGNPSQVFFDEYTSKVPGSADSARIVPFLLGNPYLEIAQAGSGADERVAGVRLGFESGLGYLSGDLLSLTGNVQGFVRGEDVQSCVQLGFFCVPVNVSFVTPFELIDGSDANGNASNRGDGNNSFSAATLKRASWFGPQNGTRIPVQALGLNLNVTVEGCDAKLAGLSTNVNTCFASNTFQSLFIGDPDVDRTKSNEEQLAESSAGGAFISLQTETVPWENLSGVGDARVNAESGAFLNIPSYINSANEISYPINLTFEEAEFGLPRIATCVGRVKGC